MIKPYRSLLLLLYTGAVLGIFTYFFPVELPVGDKIRFKSFSFRDVFLKEKPAYADITDIQKKFEQSDNQPVEITEAAVSDTIATSDTTQIVSQDTSAYTQINRDWGKPEKLKEVFSDTVESRFRIQYPENQDTLLNAFFRGLQQTDRHLFRILHYGDSQIEGDRITAALRRKMQDRFGGCGMGLIPVSDPLGNRTSLIIKSDGTWIRYKAFGPDFSRRAANRHGVLGSYFKMNFVYSIPDTTEKEENDTVPKRIYLTRKWQTSTLNLYRSSLAFPRENRFQSIKMLYHAPESSFDLTLKASRDTLEKIKIERDTLTDFSVYEHSFAQTFNTLRLTIGAKKSPELYALALDCKTGIALDNMPFRGSSGVEFTRMNTNLLRQQMKMLQVKLIILQFGVNVVPYITKDYTFYENQFYGQLRLLRSLNPEVSVLVVGVSDMSRRVEGEFVSFPNVTKIRDAQRRAAFRAGCAFWDLYEAMGGENSMPSWVFNKPALANKDFTHFTPKGAVLVAEMLYKALMTEFEKFREVQ
jgi:lysophospholipase L1-like esterase